ncbi:MAG: transcription factor FapR [bacterium]
MYVWMKEEDDLQERLTKDERRTYLAEKIAENPFLTDQDLAVMLAVSVPTIRLDRRKMGIPEVRKRVQQVAEKNSQLLRSLTEDELIGELVELQLNKVGVSALEVTEEMIFCRNKIMRGHYLFAQANSLAIALIDAEKALTGLARVRYRRPVFLGEKLIAQAKVIRNNGNNYYIKVVTKVDSEEVFSGKFVVVAIA